MADDIDAFLDAGNDDIDAFLDAGRTTQMRDAIAQPSGQEPPPNIAFEVAGRYAAPGATPYYAPPSTIDDRPRIDIRRALLTNEPTQGIREDIIRGLPATVGGLAGGVAGAGLASIPLAALGGVSGESARQGVAQAYSAATGRPFTPPGEVLRSVGTQALTQAAGQAGGLAIGAAAKAARPMVNKLGAQIIRIGSGVPTNVGEAAMANPSRLLGAKSAEETGSAIGEYLGGKRVTQSVTDPLTGVVTESIAPQGLKYNVQGLQELLPGKFIASTSDKFGLVNAALSKLSTGELGLQEALVVRQQTMKMLSTPNFQNAELAAVKQELSQAVAKLDEFIEPQLPEIGGLRQAFRDSKIAEEFSNWLPLNRNSSPNVLRSVLATREAAIGAGAALGLGGGSPLGLAALPLISPKFYGTALKGAALVGKIPGTVYRVGTQAGAGATGSALQEAYLRQNRIPVPDPAFQATGGVRSALP